MRLAISNIAWDVCEDDVIAQLLLKYDVDAIDIAPGKYFPDPLRASPQDIVKIKGWWFDRGIEITGMQALLFGTSGLSVFGCDAAQQDLLNHLAAVCCIAAGLGVTKLVFGSPKNRDRTGLTDAQAIDMAVTFFRRLGNIAQSYNVIICLEPNPSCYGANFMTTSAETAQVVQYVAHPAIKMQFDTGALTINAESAETVLSHYGGLIGHIHASEPNLVPLGDGKTDHHAIRNALDKFLPDHLVTIEMIATQDEAHFCSIERALVVANKNYRLATEVHQ